MLKTCLTSNVVSEVTFPLIEVDNGDAFVSLDLLRGPVPRGPVVHGVLRIGETENLSLAFPEEVKIVVHISGVKRFGEDASTDDYIEKCKGWVRHDSGVAPLPIQIVSLDDTLFSRIRGLYETEVLANKTVLIAGVGSGGSLIALELAKAGVGRFILIDHDRVEIGNLARHMCGLSDVGRFKTKAVRDLILNKNPYAVITTLEERCDWNNQGNLRSLIKSADLVFCATDNRESRLLLNHISLVENRVCIYGGTFSRAYGGHVLRVIPYQSLCYNCFIDLLPVEAENFEISTQQQAEALQYTDRRVPIEPGLATDIAPMALMAIKMGILELLRGTDTSFAALYDDLRFPWYQWLNRREPGTDYAKLPPLDEDGNSYRILAWYGIDVERNPACPACGNFELATRNQLGLSDAVSVQESSIFAITNKNKE